MTPNEFRELALSFTEAIESAHMHHADFRVGGRIFATLGYPDQDSATMKLTREEQIQFVRENPGRFQTGQRRLGPARKHKHLSAGGQGPNCPRSAHRSVAQHRTETAMEKSLTQVDCFTEAWAAIGRTNTSSLLRLFTRILAFPFGDLAVKKNPIGNVILAIGLFHAQQKFRCGEGN
jgi:hypothetical protein